MWPNAIKSNFKSYFDKFDIILTFKSDSKRGNDNATEAEIHLRHCYEYGFIS